MTEKEKILLAKKYIDYLSRGFNPLDESPVKNDDIVRNERISRCLMYVSEVLGEVVEKGIKAERTFTYTKEKRKAKEDFYLSYEERKGFVFSDNPLTVSEIAVGLSSLTDSEKYKSLKATVINEWLVENGFLSEETGYNGKSNKSVTAEGTTIGIISVDRISQSGFPYKRILHSKTSQEFIIDNLDAIIEYNKSRELIKKAAKHERKFKRNGRYTDILDEVIADLHSAGATVDDIVYSTDLDSETVINKMKSMKLI